LVNKKNIIDGICHHKYFLTKGKKNMKLIKLIFILVLAGTLNLLSITQEIGDFKDFLYGTSENFAYDNWMSHLVEGIASEGYNSYAPWDRQTNGFGRFLVASDSLLQRWNDVVTEFIEGQYENAQNFIELYEFPYEIVNILDSTTGNELFILRELPNPGYYDDNGTADLADDEWGAFEFGWGLFVYNPYATQPIIITAVHPNDDYISVPIAYEAFLQWDARYLMVNGTGREVAWTEIGDYTNSKSLSDPSRNADHPFQKIYKLACDKIRMEFNRREFSAQIHSCDWDRYNGYPDLQISAGFQKNCPNLPIRDLSDLKMDMINFSQPVIHSANSIGNHGDVLLNDYYGVNYSLYDFIYVNGEITFPVNNHINLPGYSQNQQMLYTQSGWNQYDVFEPFFHIEMKELPGCYETVEENWHWFYGYQSVTGTFDMNNLFSNALLYYHYWITKAAEILPYVFAMDDELTPPVPQNLSVQQQGYTSVQLSWEPVSSFDFRTFQIRYSNQPLQNGIYQIINRQHNALLASQLHTYQTVSSLQPSTVYYFQIEAIDYQNNYSELSEEVVYETASAHIGNVHAFGFDSNVLIRWLAYYQSGNTGFLISRKDTISDYVLIADWQTYPQLQGVAQSMQQYEFIDLTAENGILYHYRISAESNSGNIYDFPITAQAKPETIHSLIVSSATVADTTYFGMNMFATNGQDEYYDILNEDENQAVFSAFYQINWGQGGTYLSREIISEFNADTQYRSMQFHVSSSVEEELTINANFGLRTEKLYLYNNQTSDYFNLLAEDCQISVIPDELTKFTLYWGNLQPSLAIHLQPNRIYQTGETISLSWEAQHPILIDFMELYAYNETDTLLINANIAGSATFYEFSIAASQSIHNLKYKMKLFSTDGEVKEYISFFSFGIVPALYEVTISEGASLIANPFPEDSFSAVELFGDDVSLNNELQYETTDIFEFGAGYWLTTNETTNRIFNYPIVSELHETEIHSGWNLVPNPHLCPYPIHSLQFRIFETVFSYRQAIQEGMIANAVFSYRDGQYKSIETIEPFESFLCYVYVSETQTLLFNPYQAISQVSNTVLNWQIDFNFQQYEHDKDVFTIGAHRDCSEQFDLHFDLPSPPVKPLSSGISAYLDKTEFPDFPHVKLVREVKDYAEPENDYVKEWNFKLKLVTLDPTFIIADFINVPSSYEFYLQLGEFSEHITNQTVMQYIPAETGEIEGRITVQNNTSNQAELPDKPYLFSNYPNPFNPHTTIQFYLEQANDVTLKIYNIKGQKVRTLRHEKLAAGNYEIIWDSCDDKNKKVTAGIYFYQLNKGAEVLTRKMLLLK
jgi:hypothetical protein